MFAEVRRLAHEAAQAAFSEAVREYIVTGQWDPQITARYIAAERVVDAIDGYLTDEQKTDPEAPDYFASARWAESELRYAHGDR